MPTRGSLWDMPSWKDNLSHSMKISCQLASTSTWQQLMSTSSSLSNRYESSRSTFVLPDTHSLSNLFHSLCWSRWSTHVWSGSMPSLQRVASPGQWALEPSSLEPNLTSKLIVVWHLVPLCRHIKSQVHPICRRLALLVQFVSGPLAISKGLSNFSTWWLAERSHVEGGLFY